MKRFCLVLLLSIAASGQVRMSVDQLKTFLLSSKKLGHTDRQVADYLKNIKLTQRLDAGTIEDLTGVIGPKTIEALRRLTDTAKDLPAAPPPPARAPAVVIPPPSSMEQGRILDQVQEYGRAYSKSLPNFICTQVTRRYVDPSGLEFWQLQDVITSKLSYFEQKEDYKVIFVNNRAVTTSMERLGGVVSSGEFGSILRSLFDPKTRVQFEWQRWATLRGRRTHVFAFSVAQESASWRIASEDRAVFPAVRGLLYVDRETNSVMRITQEPESLPPDFPIQQVVQTLDYDYQQIGGTDYLLPLKSTVRSRMGRAVTKNDVEFRNYNRFGAEATITFTPEPLPEEETREQK
ncbi:MAG TPA: hypothetical protein VES20_04145 [Bryobacteraceae bacterium]|nr:hypothetical protein [Bryobacteraceae bacterium]